MATDKSRPFTIRARNDLLDECKTYKIDKSKTCNDALRQAVATEKEKRKGKRKNEKRNRSNRAVPSQECSSNPETVQS